MNVHPTKREVHFLNEDEIIESVCSVIRSKLADVDTSRTFVTQTLLPGVSNRNTSRLTGPDVREPSEYQEGYIPGAVNIPLKSQPDAIFLPEEEFEDRFGFTKPSHEQEVIFYCRAGVRSSAAAGLARQQGYPNISDYRGSWLDWEKNGGKIEKP